MNQFQGKITLKEIFVINSLRANRWHEGHPWNPLEWAGAMCGEAGEAANAAKKLKRVLDGISNINENARHLPTVEIAQKQVIKESCDTILYALLLARSAGAEAYEFEDIFRQVFNDKSVEYGFPERL
jgi:NTP pyrophosphatase (non-canonical NTP hydrolase)